MERQEEFLNRRARRGESVLASTTNLHQTQAKEDGQFDSEYAARFNEGPRQTSKIPHVSQSTSSFRRPPPRNDYELIMSKNGHHAGKFNIINNKLKNY